MQPVLLLSHGASVFSVAPAGPLHQQLRTLGATLLANRPGAVLIVSAHFVEPVWTLTASEWPTTIHDHPVKDLRGWTYPVPGAPTVAARIAQLLQAQGLVARLEPERGLDHGAWLVAAPLLPAELQIPVLQLSLHADLSPEATLQAGRALKGLRDEGVLIITSGGMTHNQQEFRTSYFAGAPLESASIPSRRFDDWLRDRLCASAGPARSVALSAFRTHPDAAWAHPSPEHLLPLFAGLGAADGCQATPLWGGFQFGLSTAAYRLD